jgi:hypothetical protein
MHSSAGRLALTILGTILFLQAAVVLAAPPPVPESAVSPAPVETIEAPAPLCAEESAAPFLDLEPLEQTGQPCCQSLCEQTCGVGEACACKRCIVLGCGV